MTTKVRSSLPGWSWVTFAKGQLAEEKCWSVIRTNDPIWILWDEWCHLKMDCNFWRYWEDHCFQNYWVRCWMNCYRDNRDSARSSRDGSGGEFRAEPVRKWSGVRALRPFGCSLRCCNGLELRIASTSVKSIESFSKVNGSSPIERRRWNLIDFTTTSDLAPICRVVGGLNFHSVKSVSNGKAIRLFSLYWETMVFSSFSTPMKFVPQSDWIH